MKTQISRWSDEPRRRRSGLYQQQGRMVLDADWNELMELSKRRIDEALAEVIGSGAPDVVTPGMTLGITLGVLEPGGAGAPLIKRASVYVDGIRASLESSVAGTGPFALNQQADFPAPPPFPTAVAQMLYADVWELSATALEDRAVLDTALHGADTSTRTQQVAQIKWCPATINPLTDARNPAKGDGICKLELREGSAAPDPCDPLAVGVQLEAPSGNYLFRLEVHEVLGAAVAPTEITLKWSSENAAEQYAQASVPADFKRSDYIYEFYNSITERHLGVHLANNFVPQRAQLREGWPSSVPDPAAFPWVRRWDGYAVLVKSGTAWTVKALAGVLQAKERGRSFTALPAGGTAVAGSFSYTAPDFSVHLDALKLTLTLDARKFVAGDYWLATVREHASATTRVQLASATPSGVTHHYVLLGTATGATLQALSDAETRRLDFPRLVELSAERLGYSPTAQNARWTDLIDDAAVATPLNAQRAIDLLVERLDSSDLNCTVANCGTAANPSPRSLLAISAGPQKLDVLFNRLLCDLNAGDLPIDKSDPGLPALLNVPAITTTQQALSTLAGVVSAPTREATVGLGGQFATLSEAFTALAGATDISLALLPGVQSLTSALTLANKRTIRIVGVGPYASRLNLAASLQLGAQEVILSDLAVVAQGAGNLVLQADRVVARSSAFSRATTWAMHQWSKRFASSGDDTSAAVAVDSNGNVLLTGSYAGTINLGGSDLPATGNEAFLAKFNAAGVHQWSKRFVGSGDDRGLAVAVDGSGNVIVTGLFTGTLNCGGADLVCNGSVNVFLAKFDALGNHVWSQRFGLGATASPTAVAVDASGNVVLVGSFTASITFGGPTFTATSSTTGNLTPDLFIAKFAPNGGHLWSKTTGGPPHDSANGVAVDASGNVLVAGSFTGAANFGGGPLTPVGGGSNIFVVKLDPAGTQLWAKSFGEPTSVDGSFNSGHGGAGIAVDASGNVLLLASISGKVNFGGAELVSRGFGDLCVVKFNAAGAHLWSKRLQTIALGRRATLVTDANNNVVIVGSFGGTENFGDGDLTSVGGNDIYVLRLEPSGNHLWSRTFGGANSEQPLGVATDASGNIVMAGLFAGTLSFGGSALVSSPLNVNDIFLAKLTPEPALNPLVTIRPRDASRGTDLVWSQNDMLATATDVSTNTRNTRIALALTAPSIGGSILGNTINGRVQLSSELPFDVAEPITMGNGTTSIGGGAYLTIRENDIARLVSRYETTAPLLDAHRTLVITGNTFAEANNALIADAITLGHNQFLTSSGTDLVAFAAARQVNLVGNQATHPSATLRGFAVTLQEAGNAFISTRIAAPAFQPNTAIPWYFGGVGADLQAV